MADTTVYAVDIEKYENAENNPSFQSRKMQQQQNKNVVSIALFTQQARQVGTQIINHSIANYSNLTGDTITQTKINQGLKMAGYASTIGLGAYAGGVGGAIVATIGVAVEIGLTEYDRVLNIEKANIESNRLLARVGLSTNGGNR